VAEQFPLGQSAERTKLDMSRSGIRSLLLLPVSVAFGYVELVVPRTKYGGLQASPLKDRAARASRSSPNSRSCWCCSLLWKWLIYGSG
jgi:hypothetical protein